MESNTNSPSARVQDSFRQLSAAAANLNNVSDELGKSIEELDAALKKLNIGVTAWASMDHGSSDISDCWWTQDIGYAKIGGKWGIALRTCSGDYSRPDEGSEEAWLFNEAPRWLRLEGIGHVPTLIEKLISETQATADKIEAKVGEAKELAKAISTITLPSPKKK
jgi:hypothetical protein